MNETEKHYTCTCPGGLNPEARFPCPCLLARRIHHELDSLRELVSMNLRAPTDSSIVKASVQNILDATAGGI